MIKYNKISERTDIYDKLTIFLDCFPHLLEKVNLSEFSDKLFERAEVYVAREADNDIGITCFYANDTVDYVGYITLIGIKKDYRGLGLGKDLLNFTESKMNEQKMKKVKLEVDADNYHAKRFYELNGFKIAKRLQHSFYMQKEL